MTATTLYTLFWGLGAFAGGVAGLLVLRARGILLPAAAATLLISWIGVMIGSKWQFRLESMPVSEALVFPMGDLLSGGRRIDLGLVLGILLASAWCLVARIPWRPAADALAVAASALIPVGRIGCMLFGCCMGVPCGPGAPFCLRFPSGSEAYNHQLRDGLIPLSAAMSLPAHPLPVYFAAASLLTLGVLVWLLRRGAPAGSLFLAFCILRPAAKLALEPLRAIPSPSPLMTAIPAVVLAGALAALGVLFIRRVMPRDRIAGGLAEPPRSRPRPAFRRLRSMARLIGLAAVGAACLAGPAHGAPSSPGCGDGRWVVDGAPSDAPLLALVLEGNRVRFEGACGGTVARLRSSPRGAVARARLPRCARGRGRIRVRMIASADCGAFSGSIRAGKRVGRVVAVRARCGDGRWDAQAGEECDGGVGCAGGRACGADCVCEGPVTLPPTSTTTTTMPAPPPPTCGDGRVDAGEVCDGGDLAGATCPDGGVLGCAADCRSLDTRGCWQCGNGRREGGEECDGLDLGPAACDAPGEMGGAIGCTADCRIDRAGCYRCGNGRVDPGEQCDDGNGALRDGCTPACRLECGNGTVEPNEECDDGAQIGGDGCSALCALEASYDGGGDDARECAVEWGVAGLVPAATMSCADGDATCDRDDVFAECTILAYICLNRTTPVLGGPPPCSPSAVAQLGLTGGSLAGPGALEAATVGALLDALAAILGRAGAAVTRDGVSLAATPPLATPRACGAVALPVPAGEERVVATRATDPAGVSDDDTLTFRCLAGGTP